METMAAAGSGAVPVVYCIGDSHVCFFSGQDRIQPDWPAKSDDQLPWFKTYRIGSSLAYNLTRHGTQTRGRERLFEVLDMRVPVGGFVLLSFGEIDCRAHLVKQSRMRGLPIEKVVEVCLDEYFKVVREIVARGFRVIVYNVVPSRLRTTGGGALKDADAFVTTGSWRERNHASRLFNDGARLRCESCDALFLENFPHLVDGQDKTIQWYFWDSIHLSQRAMPVTLERFRALCPQLVIPPQRIESPGWLELEIDGFKRRFSRVTKEIRKIPRIFGAS